MNALNWKYREYYITLMYMNAIGRKGGKYKILIIIRVIIDGKCNFKGWIYSSQEKNKYLHPNNHRQQKRKQTATLEDNANFGLSTSRELLSSML